MKIYPNRDAEKLSMRLVGMSLVPKRAARKAFYDIGKDLVKTAVALIDKKPKHGRVYRLTIGLGGRRRPLYNHFASAPGEAPAVITGELRESVNFTVHGSNKLQFGVDLTRGNAPYGKFLEYANLISMTGWGSKNIAPRPFISASYEQNKKQFPIRFHNEIMTEIGKIMSFSGGLS